MAGAMERWVWAWLRATLPPSVASRETPQHVCPPGTQENGALRGQPVACSQASPPARIDVVCESGLFSLGRGGDYSEKMGLELLGLNSEILHFPSLLACSFHFGEVDSSSGKLPRPRKWPGLQGRGPSSEKENKGQARCISGEARLWGIGPSASSASEFIHAAFRSSMPLDRNWPS